jgi:hypothetical protein
MMARKWFVAALVAALVLFGGAAAARAQGKAAGLDKARVDAAVKKGVAFLKSQQKSDGSWIGPHPMLEARYPYGTTALCLLAIVKGGEPKDSPAVTNALNYLRNNKYTSTYGTSCLILALAALVDESQDEESAGKDELKGTRTTIIEDTSKKNRKRFKRMPDWLKKMLMEAVAYLVKVKGKQVWRYPGVSVGEAGSRLSAAASGDQDASNTQYAMMALFAARRLGIKVPTSAFKSVAEYFITNQDKEGPEVKPFFVPGADLNLKEVLDMEKAWRKQFNKRLKQAKREAKKAGKDFEGVDLGTVLRENPYDKFGEELPKFYARGWAYLPNSYKGKADMGEWVHTTGAMTCSGVIACMLCKAHLEGSGNKKLVKKLKKSIRDGLAWIVHNWTTSGNPKAEGDSWRYYYFYALERAAVLSLVQVIGEHNWHNEIGGLILSEQSVNGSWPGVDRGKEGFTHGPLWNTCFAILFLKKATTPIIKPELIITGKYLLGGERDKKEKKE